MSVQRLSIGHLIDEAVAFAVFRRPERLAIMQYVSKATIIKVSSRKTSQSHWTMFMLDKHFRLGIEPNESVEQTNLMYHAENEIHNCEPECASSRITVSVR